MAVVLEIVSIARNVVFSVKSIQRDHMVAGRVKQPILCYPVLLQLYSCSSVRPLLYNRYCMSSFNSLQCRRTGGKLSSLSEELPHTMVATKCQSQPQPPWKKGGTDSLEWSSSFELHSFLTQKKTTYLFACLDFVSVWITGAELHQAYHL